MPKLIVGNLDINDKTIALSLLSSIQNLTSNQSSYSNLIVKNGTCLEVPNMKSNIGSGWYIIIENRTPLYVGRSDNLYSRLNTPNGSRDNFNNTQRSGDSIRNFIKKYSDIGVITNLRVFVIQESQLQLIGLNDTDRYNIEKFISIFRTKLTF
jgi:hypothetical protein